jgi:hypothetical protein
LRLSGLDACYRGRAGVRDWFGQLKHLHHEHRILLREARETGDGRVFATGSLRLCEEYDIGPFCALHRIEGGLIVGVHQYLSDPDMIEFLGLIP